MNFTVIKNQDLIKNTIMKSSVETVFLTVSGADGTCALRITKKQAYAVLAENIGMVARIEEHRPGEFNVTLDNS